MLSIANGLIEGPGRPYYLLLTLRYNFHLAVQITQDA